MHVLAPEELKAMPPTQFRVFENKLRRMLERRGFRLMKCRRRDERALGYGGYAIVNTRTNGVEAGDGFTLTAHDVLRWLV